MPQETIVTHLSVTVDGDDIPDDISDRITLVEVDQSAFYPSMFTVAYRMYPGEELAGGTFDLAKEVEIKIGSEPDSQISLIKGEIISIEPRFLPGMIQEMVVRGYDKSHRLYRESRSAVHLNIKDSDLANQFAGNAGLSPEVETTNTVYDAIYQDNQPDLTFLQQRAWRIGYECFVDDGKLYFRNPQSSGSVVTLSYGTNLQEFYPRLSLSEQVDMVEVKGWDWNAQQAILGKAENGELYPSTGEGKNGSSWAATFGTGKKIFVNHPVKDQAEANLVAQARLNEISGAFETATGVAANVPQIRAGQIVTLENLGSRFGGDYRVSRAVHRYSVGDFSTEFTVLGIRTGLLYDQMVQHDHQQRWGGVVPAKVTNTDDPEDYGRVKLQFPWMDENAETWWARVVSPGAGKDRGFNLIPEVGDEVIVAFEHGDINRPFVLGGVWNGQAGIPGSVKSGSSGERPLIRSWTSSSGHEIAMYETSSDKKIEIKTAAGHILVMDDTDKKIELTTSGGHSVLADDQGNTVSIKTSGGHEVVMDSSNVTIQCQGSLTIKAKANIQIEAGAMMELKASGTVTIKGAMVNIN